MSELESKIREALQAAQAAHELSYDYPNPYTGIPSPLTSFIIQAEAWLKRALGEAVACDIDKARGGQSVSAVTSQYGSKGTKVE